MPLGYEEPPEQRQAKHADVEETATRPASPPIDTGLARERGAQLQESGFLKLIEGATRESDEARYTDPESRHWRYRARPLGVTIVFGGLAALLIVGQNWLPEVSAALGGPAVGLGWLRFALFVVGAYCAFMAWPSYRPAYGRDGERRGPPPRLKTRR